METIYLNKRFATVPALPEETPKAFHGLLMEVAGLTPTKAEDAADLTETLESPKLAEALRRLAGAVNLYKTLYGPLPEPEALPNSDQPERTAAPIVDELTEWNAEYLAGHHDEWRETYQSQLP